MSPNAPTLPPNVTIFSPKDSEAAQNLLKARLFTRLSASASTSPEQLFKALSSHSGISETFYFSHGQAVLIFDAETDGAELEDAHHEHFRAVCLALRDADIGLDVAKCVHDAESVLQAGFQLDAMKNGSVLVIDLMHTADDEDGEDDEDDDSESKERDEEAGA
jgi:hypothetical protein